MKNLVFLSVVLFALLNPWNLVWAQTQAYIFKFGTDSDSDVAMDAVEDGQGRLLVCGYTNYDPDESNANRGFVFRLTPFGQLDPSFGTNGVKYIDYPNSSDKINAIAIGENGDIFLAGSTNTLNACLFRLNGSNGSAISTFGSVGRAILADAIEFKDLLILPNKQIIAVGHGYIVASQDANYVITRFTPNGFKDASFGTGGFTHVEFEDDDFAFNVARQSDGSLVVAGESWTCSSSSCNDFSITRLLANGQLDNGFGKKLYKTSPQTSTVFFGNLSLQNIGGEERPLISGINDIDPFLFRLRFNGNNDVSFGSNGFKLYPQLSLWGAHTIQADQKILIATSQTLNGVLRVKTDGSPDGTFGDNGLFSFTTPGTFDANNIIASDHAIYVVGGVANGAVTDAFVIKINNNFVSVESPDATAIGLEIFPNPSTGNATIRFNSGEGGPAQLRLFDLAGRLVYQTSIVLQGGETHNLDLSLEGRLLPGTYMLQIQTADRFANKKWVVE